MQPLSRSKVRSLRSPPFAVARLRDLQFAPQRHASVQKPLGRFVLLVDAVLATAQEVLVARTRTSPEAVSASDLLSFIDSENYMTMAMMADAGDELLILVRFVDANAFDPGALPGEVATFLARLDALFLRRGATRSGYTRHALQKLAAAPRLLRLADGTIRQIGGQPVTQDILDRCYARMAAWIKLVIQCLSAETPAYDILATFGAFALCPLPSNEVMQSSLARLAQVFNLDSGKLHAEFMVARHHACQLHKSRKDADCFQAWAESANRMSRCRNLRRQTLAGHRSSDNLRLLLARYGAFQGASTSAVERNFQLLSFSDANTNGRMQLMVLKLRAEVNAANEARILSRARQIWTVVFGSAKRSGSRWSAGAKPRSTGEAHWIRERRESIRPAQARSLVALEEAASQKALWTPSHATASAKLKILEVAGRMTAQQHNHLLPHEKLAPHIADARAEEVRQRDKADDAKKRKASALMSPVGPLV